MARLITTPPPHLRSGANVAEAMRDVLIALVPISLAGVYFFGFYAIVTLFVGMATAVITELVFRKAMKKPPTLGDYSALVTGALVALCFAGTAHWWYVALATFIGVGIVKELMGGLGWNRFNPALMGRVSLWFLTPIYTMMNPRFEQLGITEWNVDIVTHATPLGMLQQSDVPFSYGELLVGFPGGAMAEVSPLMILLGGLFLLYRGHINWRIPASIMATVVVLTTVLGLNPVHHLLTGSVFIGAFFFATDWVTSPVDTRAQLVFGTAIGALIVLFRVALPPVGGVAFAILIMNALVPHLDRWFKRASFSEPRPITLPSGHE